MGGQGWARSGIAGAALALVPFGLGVSVAPAEPVVQLAQAVDQATLSREGGPLYVRNCADCHGRQGEGGVGPKLAGHSFLSSTPAVIAQILNGFDGRMPAFRDMLNDRQVAAIGTYVRSTWGNSFGVILPTDVRASR